MYSVYTYKYNRKIIAIYYHLSNRININAEERHYKAHSVASINNVTRNQDESRGAISNRARHWRQTFTTIKTSSNARAPLKGLYFFVHLDGAREQKSVNSNCKRRAKRRRRRRRRHGSGSKCSVSWCVGSSRNQSSALYMSLRALQCAIWAWKFSSSRISIF